MRLTESSTPRCPPPGHAPQPRGLPVTEPDVSHAHNPDDGGTRWPVGRSRPRAAGRSTIPSSAPRRCRTRTRSRPSSTSSSARRSSGARGSTSAGWSCCLATAATSPRSSTSPDTSIIVVRDMDGEVRAFHNICRHRGNKLVWNDYPARGDRTASAGSSPASTTAGATTSTARLNFVQQEGEFFDLDKDEFGLVPVHCDVWEGFIFVNLAREPEQSLTRVPRADDHLARGLPVRPDDRALALPLRGEGELEALHGRLPGVLPRTGSAREAVAVEVLQRRTRGRLRGAALPDRRSAPAREHRGHPVVGARPGHAQAHRGDHPQRAVRPVGRARSRHEKLAAGREPGRRATRGASTRSSSSRTSRS